MSATLKWITETRWIDGGMDRYILKRAQQNNCRSLVVGIGEGNGTPLQYSCLENPMDGGAW